LRLAVFTNQFPSHVSTFFARDISGLLRAGVDVDILPFYPLDPTLWRYVPDILSADALPRTKVHHTALRNGVGYARSKQFRKLGTLIRHTAAASFSAARFGVVPVIKSVYVSLKASAWAQQYPNNYDHILAYWGHYAATGAYLFHHLTNCRIPFSIFVHAGIDLYQSPAQLRRKFLYADNIITCSDFNRQFICSRLSDICQVVSAKIYVHHHGLDLAEYTYQPNYRSARTILAVGSLEKYKGFDYLLRAIGELHSRGCDLDVWLLGDGGQAEALRRLANEMQIAERVRFQGWVRPAEVCDAMRQATILVHPSSELADGVPNVIKEAMAVGLPVVASGVAGIPELLQNGAHGVLVPPRNVTALANAVEGLLLNDSLRSQYADAARKYIERMFDVWERGRCLAGLLRATRRPARKHC